MEKPDYYATLGLAPNATAAEIEANYLAIVEKLDPKKQPPELRRWAEAQLVMVDEAYAALTDGDSEEVSEQPVPVSQRAATAVVPPDRRAPTPRGRPPAWEPEEDEYEDEEEDYEELEEDEPQPARRSESRRSTAPPPPAPRAPAPARPARGASAVEQPQWQQRGHRGRHGHRPATAPAARRPMPRQDDRLKNMILGLAAGLVVVLAAYFAVQSGVVGGNNGPEQGAFDQGRYNELKGIVQRDPNNYGALFELGEMNIQAGRWEETIAWFEKVLAVRPNDVHAMQDIGTANFNLGYLDEAREIWLKALEFDPNDPQTHWNLSFLYASQQPPDLEAANKSWQKVIELAPESELAKTAQAHIDSYKSRQPGAAPTAAPR